MKKPWMKRLAAAGLVITFTAGMGMTMLSAAGEEEETTVNSGGGVRIPRFNLRVK
ncbi:hypothetical protein [Anaerostipes sp.]|uniref:hypothetical protein n=1 Tax=Anaerostipes sp. TaxID=1872530 RepID=UPI0025C63417|nr:hypothetical protein [Anaerostipes sp.]MBS7009640.1 hypothetical protein [Anaerostipes sp.]